MKRSLIFLHGLGDRGASWQDIASFFANFNCIFPDAPMIPITLNGGMQMPGWYDMYQLGPGKEDQEGLLRSKELVHDLVKKEIAKGVAPENIFIGGFSQGSVVTLLAGLTLPLRLGGIIALSGYLPIKEYIKSQKINTVPIFLAHGEFDDVINFKYGLMTKHALEDFDLPVTFKSYPMGHSACIEELQDIQKWVLKQTAKEEL